MCVRQFGRALREGGDGCAGETIRGEGLCFCGGAGDGLGGGVRGGHGCDEVLLRNRCDAKRTRGDTSTTTRGEETEGHATSTNLERGRMHSDLFSILSCNRCFYSKINLLGRFSRSSVPSIALVRTLRIDVRNKFIHW